MLLCFRWMLGMPVVAGCLPSCRAMLLILLPTVGGLGAVVYHVCVTRERCRPVAGLCDQWAGHLSLPHQMHTLIPLDMLAVG